MPVRYGEIVGSPFLWNGRDSAKGLDCYGVVLWYYHQLGIDLADPVAEYSEGWGARGETHIRDRFSGCWFEPDKPWRDHDVAIIQWPGESEPTHLGVLVAGTTKVLHADKGKGVVCVPIDVLKKLFWAVARHEDLR